MERTNGAVAGALALVAPGQPLRDGLERVLLANRGALIVVGDHADVLSICTGGFLLDAEFTPQRLSELAKLDGAIIVSADAARIARANVHLMPNPSIPTSETGTRHRTAERMARSIDVPVISVSASMGVVTVYRGDNKHVLQSATRLHERTGQALQTLERFRQRLDVAVGALSALELEDTVTLRNVTAVLQPAELAVRIGDEIDRELVELGADARLLRLQLEELLDGVVPVRRLVVRDYMRAGPAAAPDPEATTTQRPSSRPGLERALQTLGRLTTEELLDARRVASALGLPPGQLDLDTAMEPRGYRLLHRLPRFPDAVIEGVVERFSGLQRIMRASVRELEEVAGVGEARARSLKDGLARLAEATILDRYS
ncbi:MAG TPA: DNA integrity scanning diadenylate cyclase DisA [Acidimicrobiales bacterium]|nr:DNA integrity scanning diadenylate cyclase DisA [Acidimicrobiales bacterium]